MPTVSAFPSSGSVVAAHYVVGTLVTSQRAGLVDLVYIPK